MARTKETSGAGGRGEVRRGEVSSSGYTTNDSYTSQTWLQVNNARNQIRDGRGSSGGSSCSSESQRSLPSPRSSSLATSPSQVSIQNSRSEKSKILLVSSVDPRNNNMMYKDRSSKRPVVTSAGDQENMMSLKKSAEIAALFSGAAINQTTDLVDPAENFRQRHRRDFSQVSHKLGYFP